MGTTCYPTLNNTCGHICARNGRGGGNVLRGGKYKVEWYEILQGFLCKNIAHGSGGTWRDTEGHGGTPRLTGNKVAQGSEQHSHGHDLGYPDSHIWHPTSLKTALGTAHHSIAKMYKKIKTKSYQNQDELNPDPSKLQCTFHIHHTAQNSPCEAMAPAKVDGK